MAVRGYGGPGSAEIRITGACNKGRALVSRGEIGERRDAGSRI